MKINTRIKPFTIFTYFNFENFRPCFLSDTKHWTMKLLEVLFGTSRAFYNLTSARFLFKEEEKKRSFLCSRDIVDEQCDTLTS